ncbi:MAG: TRAP transporter substrate-binding protein DctP [Alphaproteobacteria bacterium]|nr:TRAP transporter substrate-binding protein DctP [Alphaproteobacteria bacterium]
MAEAVRAETGRRLEVAVFPESRLGPDPAMLADLQRGRLEFYLSGNLLAGIVPETELPSLPFAFDDSQAVFAALDGELGAVIRAGLAQRGLHAFPHCCNNGFHQITTANRAIHTAEDFTGLRIRTPGGAMAADFFRTLGAEAGFVPFSGMYDALGAGEFDGQSDPLGVVQALKLHEVQRYLSLTDHWWTGFTLLAGDAAWRALPADLQESVTRHAARFALLQRADIDAINASGAAALAAAGMQVNAADRSSLRKALSDFYTRWQRRFDPAAWRTLERYTDALS